MKRRNIMNRKNNNTKQTTKKPYAYRSALAMTTAAIMCFCGIAFVSADNAKNSEVVLGREADQQAASDNTIESLVSEVSGDDTELGRTDGDLAVLTDTDDEEEMTIPEIVNDVLPCMVQITNTAVGEYSNMFGETQEYEEVSTGTGIIVGKTDDELLIATNDHVIDGNDTITITFNDGENNESGSEAEGIVKGTDSLNDLAIVAVKLSDLDQSTLDAINVIRLGDSDEMQVGEQVVAIGNALGYGQSVSTGILSAKGREVMDSDGETHIMFQTDASINPGNSGGALLNMKGELIGINEAKYVDESVEGVGYAIPMSIAEPILTELGNRETREKVADEDAAYLGVYVMSMPAAYVAEGYPAGAYVQSVVEGLAADNAGIMAQDIITKIDGINITSSSDLVDELAYYSAGEEVELTIMRLDDLDDEEFTEITVTVTLGAKEDSEENAEQAAEDNKQRRDDDSQGLFERDDDFGSDEFGADEDASEEDEDTAERDGETVYEDDEKGYLGIVCMTMPEEYVNNGYPEGAYIQEIQEGSAAEEAGLLEADIITSFGGKEITSLEDILEEISHYKAGETVSVTVSRMTDGHFEEVETEVTLHENPDADDDDLLDKDSAGLFGGSGDEAEDESEENLLDRDTDGLFGGSGQEEDAEEDWESILDWFGGQGFGGRR